jgi:hypothetical protein
MSDTSLYPSHPCQGSHSLAGGRLAGFCFVLLLLLVPVRPASGATPAPPAQAAPVVTSTPLVQTPVFAFLGLNKLMAGVTADRTNVVRFCVLVMAVALFIMLKK